MPIRDFALKSVMGEESFLRTWRPRRPRSTTLETMVLLFLGCLLSALSSAARVNRRW